MHTARGDGVAGIKRCRRDLSSDGVRNLAIASGRGRLKRGSRIIYMSTASGLQSDAVAVMATPSISVSTEGNLRDPIDIRMDIIHPEPVVVVAFSATTVVRTLAQHGEVIRGIQEQLVGVPIQEELMALRFRIDITEAEIASLRARNKTTEAIEKITHNREGQAREKMERQLGLIQEELESLRRSRLP
ncbi:hypothetical protein Tco_0149392 [Tanacetum coccineum]